MRRFFTFLLAAILTTACLGTLVRAPTPPGLVHSTTRAHLLAAPTKINANVCPNGLAEVFTYVPVWGVVVGILTFGILVPTTTNYACAVER